MWNTPNNVTTYLRGTAQGTSWFNTGGLLPANNGLLTPLYQHMCTSTTTNGTTTWTCPFGGLGH